MFLFVCSKRNQKGTRECGSEERHAERAFQVATPGPHFYGSGPLRAFGKPRRAKSRFVSVLFSAHWGLLPSKFVGCFILSHAAWCLPTCSVRRWSGGSACPIADQLPRFFRIRRRPYNADNFKLHTGQGPVSPRQEGRKVLFSEPPDVSARSSGGRPP